ncbi:hypothetical protein D9M71_671300 [compost metagenome]
MATPVSVMMPMMTPTRVQAMPTGTAWRAPSARAMTQARKVVRPPCTKKQAKTRAAITSRMTPMPRRKKPEQSTPSATQKATRSQVLLARRIIVEPRMTMAVKARPTMPEYSGVRPENSRAISTIKGISRNHRWRNAPRALGHCSGGRPWRWLRRASR